MQATLVPRQKAPGPLLSQLRLEADLAVVCNPGKPVYDIPYQLGTELTLQPELGGYLPAGSSGEPLQVTLPGGAIMDVRGEAAGAPPGPDGPPTQGGANR